MENHRYPKIIIQRLVRLDFTTESNELNWFTQLKTLLAKYDVVLPELDMLPKAAIENIADKVILFNRYKDLETTVPIPRRSQRVYTFFSIFNRVWQQRAIVKEALGCCYVDDARVEYRGQTDGGKRSPEEVESQLGSSTGKNERRKEENDEVRGAFTPHLKEKVRSVETLYRVVNFHSARWQDYKVKDDRECGPALVGNDECV
ncbi:hypothetical protein QE152_g29862 [Popillia japonica]|uniref:Uncharacterized protein n=1 Tax=Popillia japonica TaxID=7064 RepID=A0AAW1JGL7_POPJA